MGKLIIVSPIIANLRMIHNRSKYPFSAFKSVILSLFFWDKIFGQICPPKYTKWILSISFEMEMIIFPM
jgi:hypothetical protein